MASVTWDLSAQIFIPRGDTFALSSSTLGGPDTLGVPNFEVGDWVDLTCETGEIQIKQGFADNDPLSQYETGMCDLYLKGLTYAPTLNEAILPGVYIRVLTSHPIYFNEFPGTFDEEFLVATSSGESMVLFQGYILDAIEDHKENTVTIQAVDGWHKIVNEANTTSMTGILYSSIPYQYTFWNDLEIDIRVPYTEMPSEYYSGGPVTDGKFTATTTFLSTVTIGTPWYLNVQASYNGVGSYTVTVTRLRAATPELCVPGTATEEAGTGTGVGGETYWSPTDDYYRYKVVIAPSGGATCNVPLLYQEAYMAYMPEVTAETLHIAQNTAIGSMWMDNANNLCISRNTVWYDQEPTIRISDIHEGVHLCYYDYEQGTSLSSVLNSIEQTNIGAGGTETKTVHSDPSSVLLYGRRNKNITTTSTTLNPWGADQLIKAANLPEAKVSRVTVALDKQNLHLIPQLQDTVQFERDGTTQYLRVCRREISLTPTQMYADLEFFSYIPYEGLGL